MYPQLLVPEKDLLPFWQFARLQYTWSRDTPYDPLWNFPEATMKLKNCGKVKNSSVYVRTGQGKVQWLCIGRSMPLSGFMDFSPTSRLRHSVLGELLKNSNQNRGI